MLPGKKYTPEDIVRILLRRAWLILLPLALGAGAAVAVGNRLPDLYRSETLIMIVPQRIPDSYVRATVTGRIEDRLATLSDQILSRSRLERIILDLDLYQDLRRSMPMEDVVQRMRGDIVPPKIESKESFRISYVSRDPKTAQKTTERLASLFIEENLRDRENLAEDTNQFLDAQMQDAKRRLQESEKKLEEYRERYGPEMPSQSGANLQAIQNLQVQLQNLADASNRGSENRTLLARQLADLQSAAAPVAAAPGTSQEGLSREPAAVQLQAARASLQLLLTRVKPDHPDVKTLERTIRDLEARVEQEKAQAAKGSVPEQVLTPAEQDRQKRIRDLKDDMATIDRQAEERQDQEKRIRASIADYQAKLANLPRRESELVELNRDYTTLQGTYQSLLAKRTESQIAANLERRNIGEQFKVLDPARVPGRPFSPIRWQIDLMGIAGGLLTGVFLVGFLEFRDSSINHETEVARLFNLPVLALVPLMTSAEETRARRRRILVVSAALVVLIGIAGVFALRVMR